MSFEPLDFSFDGVILWDWYTDTGIFSVNIHKPGQLFFHVDCLAGLFLGKKTVSIFSLKIEFKENMEDFFNVKAQKCNWKSEF